MPDDFLKYPTLYGGRTDAPVGYCYLHKRALTVTQLKKKECLKKQCDCLKRYEQHPFWAKREEKKEKRRARKAALRGEDVTNETTEKPEAESQQQDPAAQTQGA